MRRANWACSERPSNHLGGHSDGPLQEPDHRQNHGDADPDDRGANRLEQGAADKHPLANFQTQEADQNYRRENRGADTDRAERPNPLHPKTASGNAGQRTNNGPEQGEIAVTDRRRTGRLRDGMKGIGELMDDENASSAQQT